MHNYLKDSPILTEEERLTNKQNPDVVTAYHRSMAVYLMIELNLRRRYEIDTLFMAVNIMDRYLAAVIPKQGFNATKMDLLACSCLLLAAKLEQP